MRHNIVFLLCLGFVLEDKQERDSLESHENCTENVHHGLHHDNETEIEKNETEHHEKGPRVRRDDSWLSNGWKAVENGVNKTEGFIQTKANSAAEVISSGMQQAGTALNNGWSQVKNTAQQAGQALSNQIKSAENAISNFGTNSQGSSSFSSFNSGSSPFNSGSSPFNSGSNLFNTGSNSLNSNQIPSQISSNLQSAANQFGQVSSQLGQTASNAFGQAASNGQNWLGSQTGQFSAGSLDPYAAQNSYNAALANMAANPQTMQTQSPKGFFDQVSSFFKNIGK